jgi:uncharacterized protein (TIGR01777 family)
VTSATRNDDLVAEWKPNSGVTRPELLDGLDAVVHLAGRPIGSQRWTATEKQLIRESRVLSTERLVEQIIQLKNRPSLFLSASAVGIYGDCADAVINERADVGKGFLAELARDWEQASRPLTDLGIRVVHARFGIVLSRRGGALEKMLPIFRWGLGGVLGSGKQFWSWISLDDCVSALLKLIQDKSMHGPYNLVSPQPVTNRQFTKTLGNIFKRPTFLPVPPFALRLGLGQMADELLLTSCRAIPSRLQEAGFRFQDPDLSVCLSRLLRS